MASPRTLSRLEQLEARLARAQEARVAQAAAVEAELQRLSTIYHRTRTDLQRTREERDEAIRIAHLEREERERQMVLATMAKAPAALPEARPAATPADDAADDAAEAPADRVAEAGETLEEFVRRRLPPEALETRELLPGHLPEVPGFRVIDVIGRGGMASVFRAKREADGQEVALKLLMSERGNAQSRTELFLREAALMLQVDHPGLVRALDAGECAYGLYLVLPLVEGRSLAGRVRRKGPLDEATAVRVALEVGRALRYCARGGLTHRDVKPSNLLEGPDGRIQLCDFGLAALHNGDAGRPYGSPGFAAPEQILTPENVDERADIYGLGTTLWCLVVGRRPFEGDARKSFEAARRTDLSDPRIEGADISPRLARVIRRMGRCDRARRYRNWDECLLDLMLVEKGNPPLAAQLSEALGTDRIGSAGDERPLATPEATASRAMDAAGDEAHAREARGVPRIAPWALVCAGLATLVLLGMFVVGLSASPVDALESKARAMAAEGRSAQAAAALRRAADLLDPGEAEYVRRVADELESR